LVELGEFDEASNELAIAARLDPENPWPHFEMALVLLKTGRDAKAIDELRAALRIQPDNLEILTFTAHVLAADENVAARNGPAAMTLAIKANVLTGSSQSTVLDVLGMACAEAGRFADASAATQKAIDLATAAKLTNLEELQQRLEQYQKNQPWRESFRATNAPVTPQ
jgi:predicted Zn-dependent protease